MPYPNEDAAVAGPTRQISGDWNPDGPTHPEDMDLDFEPEADEFGPATYSLSREAKRRKWWRDGIINAVYMASWCACVAAIPR